MAFDVCQTTVLIVHKNGMNQLEVRSGSEKIKVPNITRFVSRKKIRTSCLTEVYKEHQ